MKNGLPEGWTLAPLGEIAEINPRHPRAMDDSTLVSFAPMAALSSSRPEFELLQERRLGEVRRGFTHFSDGDVLFAKITPCMENGKGAVATGLRNGIGCGTTELHIIRLRDGVDPHYIYRYLAQPCIRRAARDRFTGTAGQARVPRSFIEELEIPLPPLSEQRLIVTKLEEVLSRLDECDHRLAKVSALLRQFRRRLLGAACSGRVTTAWRELRTGSRSAQRDRRVVKSVATGRSEWSVGDDSFLIGPGEASANALPRGWRWIDLNRLCISMEYGTSSKSQSTGAVPVLRMGNIQNGEVDWTNLAYTSDDVEIKRYLLSPNTVLFNRTNSPELVGKTGIYRGEWPAIFAGYLIRINVRAELDPEYLNYCLNTPRAQRFFTEVKSDGVSQSNINAQKLGTFKVPFCPLVEQREVVRRVKELLAIVSGIESLSGRAHERIEQLRATLLVKAFRGELVVF